MSNVLPDGLDERGFGELLYLFELDSKSITLIRVSQNYVYTAETQEGRRIVRISAGRHRSYEEIDSELKWVFWLGNQGVNVALPVKSRNSRFCEQLDYKGISYLMAVFHHVPGRKPDHNDLTESFCRSVGEIIGRMHRAWTEADGFHMKRNGWRESRLLNEDLLTSTAPISELFVSSLQQMQEEVDSVVKNEHNYGLIHGDVNAGNIHVDDGRLWIFDFDNCEFGYFVQDLATFLYDSLYSKLVNRTAPESLTDAVRLRWNALMRGYREHGPLKEVSANTLRCFLLIREAIIYIHYHRILSERTLLEDSDFLNAMKRNVEGKTHRLDFERIASV